MTEEREREREHKVWKVAGEVDTATLLLLLGNGNGNGNAKAVPLGLLQRCGTKQVMGGEGEENKACRGERNGAGKHHSCSGAVGATRICREQ